MSPDRSTSSLRSSPAPDHDAVDPSSADLRLRLPTWARAWLVVFPLLLIGLFLSPLPVRGNEGSLVPQVLVAGAAVALAARMFAMGATGTPDGRLVVRATS